MALCVFVALLLCVLGLVRGFDVRMQEQLSQDQTVEVDLWARMLRVRMEEPLRLLTLIAQNVQAIGLDKPKIIETWVKQGNTNFWVFDELYMVLSTGEKKSFSALAKLDEQGVDAMFRTIASGQPLITYISTLDDGVYLRLLLSVPLYDANERVSGALATVMELPVATLMPAVVTPSKHVQYMVLGAGGKVLLHSDAVQRGKSIQSALGGLAKAWPTLLSSSEIHVDTFAWNRNLISRASMSLPHWQVVVMRDMSVEWWSFSGWFLFFVGMLLTGLGVWLLRRGTPWVMRGERLEFTGLESSADLASQLSLYGGARAMFDAVPFAMLLEQEGGVRLATPQVIVMLGYFGADDMFPSPEEWFESAEVLADVRHALIDAGSFEGCVRLHKKDGGCMSVDVWAWVPAKLSDAVVWRLQLPWRDTKAMPLLNSQHIWQNTLMGMPSREAFVWNLQAWMSNSLQLEQDRIDAVTRIPAQGCLLFVDVDHLGMTNETTSREFGNKILRHVGRLVVSYTHPLGWAAHIGGDEFAVLLPGISLAHAQGIGQALCDAMTHWQPCWGGERHWVSISVGVVMIDAARHLPQQALHAADMACYEAKRRGRCQVAVGKIAVPPSQSVFPMP